MSNLKTSPKRKKNNVMFGQSMWYNYYAGYSDEFVYKYLNKFATQFDCPKILDPWTGSGTTNLVANYLGYENFGFDINPAMVIISKAKQYNVNLVNREFLSTVLNSNNLKQDIFITIEQDYLLTWFDEESVKLIRSFEYLIQIEVLRFKDAIPINLMDINTLTCDICFYYMALFHTVKSFTSNIMCSNPTWIKTQNIQNKIKITENELLDEFFRYILNAKNNFTEIKESKSHIILSDSKAIDIPKNQINVVITSPPYCTRIDYAISTVIELAIIGFSEHAINELRKTMLGTPKITYNYLEAENFIMNSTTANKVLEKIKHHNSKAAKTYYYKTYFQYFYGMQLSIEQIDKVVEPNGIVIFVVQDSYFKNINVNLSKCVTEMFMHLGYRSIDKQSYLVSNNMRYINSNSRKYKGTTKTRERIIVLRKADKYE